MPRTTRHDLAPRVEMLPLIDVIFLLLTFFIYSMVVMVQAELLPVTLTTIETGGQQETTNDVVAITIDHAGQLHWNRKPLDPEALNEKLAQHITNQAPPTIYIAMQADSSTDRGPVLINLVEKLRAADIQDFVLVGQPKENATNP